MRQQGLSGRSFLEDTYGMWCTGATCSLYGKDPYNLLRSGVFYCRYVAKSLV